MNPYITEIGPILLELLPIINEVISNNLYYDKKPGYSDNKKTYNDPVASQTDPMMKELNRRVNDNIKAFGKELFDNREIFTFVQNNINSDKGEEILKVLPEFIERQNITLMVQNSSNGVFLPIHKDHYRKSTMFYLLSGENYETRWYEPNKEFEVFYYQIASPKDVDLTYKTILKTNTWYAFNNDTYHSVHKVADSDEIRSTFLIEFVNLPYVKLIEVLDCNGLIK